MVRPAQLRNRTTREPYATVWKQNPNPNPTVQIKFQFLEIGTQIHPTRTVATHHQSPYRLHPTPTFQRIITQFTSVHFLNLQATTIILPYPAVV